MKEKAIVNTIAIFLGLLASGASYAAYSESDYAQVISAKDARIEQLRNKEIQQLALVLSRNMPNEQAPDMLLRLAELFTEKYRLYFLSETEIWQKKMDTYLSKAIQQQKRLPRPVIDNGGSKQFLGKAIQVLNRIQNLKIRYSRMDEVYYFLGFNSWEIGKKQDSVKYFTQIANSYPKSRYAPEAYRYIGDYAFSERNFDRAAEYYKKASSYDTPAKAKVLYGLAWSYFKQRQYKQATATMRSAIELAKDQAGDAAMRGVALQRDAYDALALFYTESGDAKQAGDYFSSLVGKNESIDILRKLAANYQRQGRFSQALTVNKALVEMGGAAQKAGDEQRYSIMLDSIRVAGNTGDRDREAALIKTLVAEFVINAKIKDEERVEHSRMLLRKVALLAHQEANKAKAPKPIFARAEDLYRVYLSTFGGKLPREEFWEIHYLLADALSQQNKNADAAQEFQSILAAADEGTKEAKKYQKDSAIGLIYSLDAALKEEKHNWSVEEADQLAQAVDTYAKLYPNEKDVPKYLARAAGVMVTSKRMNDARPRLEFLARHYPSSKEGLDAAVLLMKDAEDSEAWDRVSSLSAAFLASKELMAQDKNGQLRKQLESVQSRAQFKEVKTLEEGKNYAEAAQQYEKLANQSKDKEVRFKALTNAAVTYEKAGDTENQLRIYESLLRIYPGDERASKNILSMGNTAFLAGDYSKAALYFEKYYVAIESLVPTMNAKKQEDAIDAIRNAAYLREANGQGEAANEDLRKIVAAANKGIPQARVVAEEILARSADRFRQLGDSVEALRAYQRYVQAFPEGRFAADANLQSGILYSNLREDDKAKASFNKALQIAKKGGKSSDSRTLSAGAQAKLLLLKNAEEAFFRMPLRLPETKLKADIGAKLKAMDELVKGFVEVVDFGDGPWGVEALNHMASVYRNFGESLESAPAPAEYSPEDKAKFKAQLKQVAGPVYQKMNETLESALRNGENLFVAGPAMAKVYLLAALTNVRSERLPLAYQVDWKKPSDWLVGEVPADQETLAAKREILKTQPDNAAAWVALGNWYIEEGKNDLGHVFYLRALDANKKSTAAISNLAYLEGRAGNWQAALAGYRAALEIDEFAIQPKKDLARIYMASGLWRHANLAYRQLEVRAPNDIEVKRGLGLSYLATGKVAQAEPLLASGAGSETNTRFAKAVLSMGKDDMSNARKQMTAISNNEMADLILKYWNP